MPFPRGVGVPFPMIHAARVPHVPEVPHDFNSQRALPPRRQIRTIRVPLRGPPPTPLIPPRQREDDVRFERSPFNVFTLVPGIVRSPSVVGVPYSGATPSFTTLRNPAPVPRNPGPAHLIMRPRRLDFEGLPAPNPGESGNRNLKLTHRNSV